METKLFSGLPIMRKTAIELFRFKTSRRSRDNNIELRVLKLRTFLNLFDFFWVQYINDRPQLDLALKVLSGKASENGEIFEGEFVSSFDEKNLLPMKRTEKIAERVFLLNTADDLKSLEVATEREAKKALNCEVVYIALIQVKKGKFAFPVWIDADTSFGYHTVSFWGRKQTLQEVDFVTKVDIGEKLYRKTFTVCSNVEGMYLL